MAIPAGSTGEDGFYPACLRGPKPQTLKPGNVAEDVDYPGVLVWSQTL